MPEEITPQATPITNTGEPEWFPPAQDDDSEVHRPQPSAVHSIFYGRDGLRAGWSILLWFLFTFLIGALVTQGLRHAFPRPKGSPAPEWMVLSNSAIFFVITGAAGYLVSLIERRPWSDYGIGRLRGRLGEFGLGSLMGFALLSALIGLLWEGHFLSFGGLVLHGAGTIVVWALVFAVSFLFTGLFEEFAFRGFLQFTLTRGIAGVLRAVGMEEHARAIGFWITAILLAVVFGAVHAGNPGEGRIGLYAAGLVGFAFAFSLWRTGSLWWAIGFHSAWDWAESFFYGTADSGGVSVHRLLQSAPKGNTLYSGGTVGPEGSAWVFVVIALTFLLIAVTLKPRPGSPAAEFAASSQS